MGLQQNGQERFERPCTCHNVSNSYVSFNENGKHVSFNENDKHLSNESEEIKYVGEFRNHHKKNGKNGPCPYVLNAFEDDVVHTPYRCKSPFVPSFKRVTKIFVFPSFIWARVDAFIDRLSRWGRNTDGLVEHLWSHMKLGGSVPGTVLGKLRVGTKIVTRGGLENLFKLNFSCEPTERLLKTSACYLSISTGPVAGLLFVSTDKIAFCSDRPVSYKAKNGNASCYYRVVIPHERVKSISPVENSSKPCDKFIQVETVDGHEFWFMGFVHYSRALRHLQQISMKVL